MAARKKRSGRGSKARPQRSLEAAKTGGKKRAPPATRPSPAGARPFALEHLQVEPLRAEATAALGRGEVVSLLTGRSEEGARVETLVFTPSGTAAQSSGTFVHRGTWNGSRLITDRGHLLDADGACFCRDCEAAGGYTIDDDE